MTMPQKIRAWKTSDSIGSTHGWNETIGDTLYIRADIVGELARVLDDVTEVNLVIDKLPIELVEQVDSILSRINAIMEGK